MVETFFWRGGTNLLEQIRNYSSLILLSGPPSCGKTSLLFQFAFNVAVAETKSSNPNVVFLCNRQKLDSKPPFLSQGIDASSDVFHHIQMKVCQERYSNPRGQDLAMVRTLALCHNAITYANQNGSCKLLLSDTHRGESPRLLFIYKKWISTIFIIKEGDEYKSFILKDRSYSASDNSGKRKAAKYSIALQYLVLERIIDDHRE